MRAIIFLLPLLVSGANANFVCTACKDAMIAIQKIIQDNQGNIIQKATTELNKACKAIPFHFLDKPCEDLLDPEVKKLVAWLEQGLSPAQVCAKIHACKSFQIPEEKLKIPVCNICKKGCGIAENTLGNDEAKIAAVVDKICKKIPIPQLESICETLAAKVVAAIVGKLDHEDCGTVCAKIHACKASQEEVVVPESESINKCAICQQLLGYLAKLIKQDAPQIAKFAEKICNIVPSQYRQVCDAEIDKLIKAGSGDFNPKKICSMLKLCSSEPELITPLRMNFECLVCDDVCKIAEAWLTKNGKQIDKDSAKDICNLLPGPLKFLKKDCLSLLQKLINEGLGKAEGFNCNNVCHKICGKKLEQEKVAPIQNEGFLCDGCMKGIQGILNLLQTSAIEAKIQVTFLDACKAVIKNQDEEQQCEAIIKQTFPKLWAKILSFLNPKQLCQEIKLCASSESEANTALEVMIAGSNPLGGLGCSFCKTVFTWFQSNILTPAMEKKMLSAITGVCQYLMNEDYIQECTQMVDKYGDKLFKYVINALSPANICKEVDACK